MPHTLLDYARQTSDDLQRGVIETFIGAADMLRFLPFETRTSGVYAYDIETALPTTSTRGINEANPEMLGEETRLTETVVHYGGDIKTDVVLVDMHGVDRHARDVNKALKSFAHSYFSQVGSGALGAKTFPGLTARNSLYGNSVTNGGATNAISLTSLDEAIDAVEGPNKVIFMSRAAKRRITAYARSLGYGILGFTAQELGRQIETYNGLPIIVTDPLGASSAFAPTGASGVIIVASLAPGYVQGLQIAPPSSNFMGEIDSMPQLLTRVKWSAGLIVEHPRASVTLTVCNDTIAAVA